MTRSEYPIPIPTSTRFYPLCVPPYPPYPGFAESPYGLTHERVETFADGTVKKEIVADCDARDDAGLGGVSNTDFVDEDWVALCFARVHVGRVRY